MDKKTRDILEKNYLYITPQGDLLYGAAGFDRWAANTNQSDKTVTLAKVYARTLANFNRHRAHQGWIDATLKVRSTFGESFLDKLLYADFYSLPQFGKTRLGSLVLYAKQSQNRALISLVCEQIKPLVNKIIDEYNVDAVAFIPPSVPRSVQFQTELAAGLNLALPVIDLVKARSGQVIVAQKTLEKLSERVTNARDSIFVRNKTVGYKNVLLIDDAVGSGASLNETAKKIRAGATGKIKVIGFAVVGSYQKFDVIREV
ncbi:hypothetical protein M1345_02065 [Patescibacteria group bacterium]|nr:hypothetical protein [Patescibacteria group bacterium]